MEKGIWFLVFLVLNFGALGIGGLLMNNGPSSNWYMELNRAPWTPPGWVFGAAWTVIMICFSGYLAYLKFSIPSNTFWSLFLIQIVLNASWNFVFFNQHLVGLGLVVIVMLTVLVGYYLLSFWKVLDLKSFLILPYFSWLIIACSLNAYVYFNN